MSDLRTRYERNRRAAARVYVIAAQKAGRPVPARVWRIAEGDER